MVAVLPANLITLPEVCGMNGLQECRYDGIFAKFFWDTGGGILAVLVAGIALLLMKKMKKMSLVC